MSLLSSITVLMLAVSVAWMLWLLNRLKKRVERLEHPLKGVKFSEGTHDRGVRFYVDDETGIPMTLAEYLQRGL